VMGSTPVKKPSPAEWPEGDAGHNGVPEQEHVLACP
jgi:hypothetical protein